MILPTLNNTTGTIITCYSFKGGVGRSMCLANLAVLLSRAGRRVLCVDWDLEAPGLDRYFTALPRSSGTLRPSLTSPRRPGGLLALLESTNAETAILAWPDYIRTRTGPDGHTLDILGSGDDSPDYSARLSQFSWSSYFSVHRGGETIEQLRTAWKRHYDYVLVDSRTGLTDASGICSIQLPDLLLLFFAANNQNIDWSARVAKSIREGRRNLPYDRAFLTILPVLSRFDAREESDRAAEALDRISTSFEQYFAEWLPTPIKARDVLAWTALPYVPRYSFDEALAVEDEPETGAQGLSFYYHFLSKLILARFHGIRSILAGVGVAGAALPSLPANSELRSALESDPLALDAFSDRLRLRAEEEPEDALDGYERLALVLVSMGRSSSAETLLNEALTRWAVTSAITSEQAARLKSQLLDISLKAGGPRDPRTTESSSAPPFVTRLRHAYALEAEGRFQEAADAVEQLYDELGSSAAPRDQAMVLKQLGGLLQRLARFEESIEVYQHCDKLLASPEDVLPKTAIRLSLSGVLKQVGRLDEAADVLQDVVSTLEREDDPRRLGGALAGLGNILYGLGRLDEAAAALQRSATIMAEAGEHRGVATAQNNLAQVQRRLGRPHEALGANRQAIAALQLVNDQRGMALAMSSLAVTLSRLGRLGESVEARREAVSLLRNLNDRRALALSLSALASALERNGDDTSALEAYQEAVTVHTALNDKRGLIRTLCGMGSTLTRLGNFESAERTFRECLALCSALGDRRLQIDTQRAFGAMFSARGDLSGAIAQLEAAFRAALEEPQDRRLELVVRPLIRTLRLKNDDAQAASVISRVRAVAPEHRVLRRL